MAYNDQNDSRYTTSHESSTQPWRLQTIINELEARCKILEEENKRLNETVHKYKTEFDVETSYLKRQVTNEREKQMKWKNLYYEAHSELSEIRHQQKQQQFRQQQNNAIVTSTSNPNNSDNNNNNNIEINDQNNNNNPIWRRIPPPHALNGSCLECEKERKRSSDTEVTSIPTIRYHPLNILTQGSTSSLHPSPKEPHHHDDPHHVTVYPSPSPHPQPSPYSQMSNPSLPSPKAQQTTKLFYDCRICGMRYDSEQKLHFHRQVHTPVRSRHPSVGDYPTEFTATSSASTSEYWKCPECGQNFVNDEDYSRHLLIHMFKCRYCGIVLDSETNFLRHMQTHNETIPLYTCFLCEKQFPTAQQLSRHLISHPDELNFTCKECNKSFTRKVQLTRHVAAVHNKSRPYPCKDCGKKFAHKTHLRRHEIVHSGLRPHQCKVCHQSFSRKSSLSRHYFIHTTEKPFVCPICDKGFNRKGRLKNHLNIHIREGYSQLSDYVIERRPITREFIEQINQVRNDENVLADEMGYTTMSDIHHRAPSFVVKSEPHEYEVKEQSGSYGKNESDDSSCSDSDDGDIDENDADMSEEITFDQPTSSRFLKVDEEIQKRKEHFRERSEPVNFIQPVEENDQTSDDEKVTSRTESRTESETRLNKDEMEKTNVDSKDSHE